MTDARQSGGMAGPMSPERPARSGRHRHHALRQIREMIISGDLEPGMRLRECALAEQLGMSRTPVREALRMLRVEGLVKAAPHRSVTVNAPDMREAADIFIILGELGRLAGQLCSYRAICARRADVDRLYTDLVRCYRDDDVRAFLKASWRMHEAVIQSSRSWPLMLVWRALVSRIERLPLAASEDQRQWARALEQHRKISQAFGEADGLALGQLIEAYFADCARDIRLAERGAQSERRAAELLAEAESRA